MGLRSGPQGSVVLLRAGPAAWWSERSTGFAFAVQILVLSLSGLCPWASFLISSNLSFLFCKLGVIITHMQDCVSFEDDVNQVPGVT